MPLREGKEQALTVLFKLLFAAPSKNVSVNLDVDENEGTPSSLFDVDIGYLAQTKLFDVLVGQCCAFHLRYYFVSYVRTFTY